MKYRIALLMIFVLIGIFALSCGGPKAVRIGVIIDLSGPTKEYGLSMKRGIDLAAEEINNDPKMVKDFLGGSIIELVYFDSRGDRKGARAAFVQLNKEGISILIGPGSSDESLEVAPLAQKTQTLMLTPTASTPNLTKVGGEYVLRNTTSDIIEAVRMVEICDEIGYDKVSILWQNVEYSTQWASAFRERFLEKKGIIRLMKHFTSDDESFDELLKETVESDPDAILLAGYYKPCSKIITELSQLDKYYPVIGPGSFYNSEFFKLVKDTGDGILFTYPDYDPNSTKQHVMKFVESYKDKYNAVPDIFAASSYDSLMLITYAFRRAGSTRVSSKELRDNLVRIQNFPGISGETSFNPSTGECIKSPKLGVIISGEVTSYELESYKELIEELKSNK